jgi:hypothetical protein
MRTKGSCRFEAYYKAEVFDPRIAAFRPIQKSYASEQLARESFPKGKTCRVVKTTEKGKEILP